jgi:hypothetical protein
MEVHCQCLALSPTADWVRYGKLYHLPGALCDVRGPCQGGDARAGMDGAGKRCAIQELRGHRDVSPKIRYTLMLDRDGRGVHRPADRLRDGLYGAVRGFGCARVDGEVVDCRRPRPHTHGCLQACPGDVRMPVCRRFEGRTTAAWFRVRRRSAAVFAGRIGTSHEEAFLWREADAKLFLDKPSKNVRHRGRPRGSELPAHPAAGCGCRSWSWPDPCGRAVAEWCGCRCRVEAGEWRRSGERCGR